MRWIKKFTYICPVVMDGFPDAHHVFLQVDHQRFCVSPHGCDTKEDAEWTRDMLCIALERMIAEFCDADWKRDDFAKSIDECYAAIRARKAAGGPGWPPVSSDV